ncbi:hypothetical protein QA601_02675 [Chitinispirillales bacterium ANBcel5]|uniref:hypothetical protein n=1 Tax=Cellulosispirillum alkaliphilum TaxID=3039283 RepID=UPI002A56626C|nr:hypothetical protein [Chitinispirillales bacterium ANBcel5]
MIRFHNTATGSLYPLTGEVANSSLDYFVDDMVRYTFSDSLTRGYDRSFGRWVIYGSSPQMGGNSAITVSQVPNSTTGGTLDVTAVLGESFQYPFEGIGTLPASKNSGVIMNLSSMSSFTFDARGQGTLRMRFGSDLLDEADEQRQYSYTFGLTEDWQQIEVTPEMLQLFTYDADAEAQFPWADASKRINRIEFEFSYFHNSIGDTLCFESESMIFHGVRFEEMVELPVK